MVSTFQINKPDLVHRQLIYMHLTTSTLMVVMPSLLCNHPSEYSVIPHGLLHMLQMRCTCQRYVGWKGGLWIIYWENLTCLGQSLWFMYIKCRFRYSLACLPSNMSRKIVSIGVSHITHDKTKLRYSLFLTRPIAAHVCHDCAALMAVNAYERDTRTEPSREWRGAKTRWVSASGVGSDLTVQYGPSAEQWASGAWKQPWIWMQNSW